MPAERLRWDLVRRTSSFRLTLALGILFALGTATLLGIIYVSTSALLINRSDHILRQEAERLALVQPDRLPAAIAAALNLRSDLHYLELFSAAGEPVAGNLPIDRPDGPPGQPFDAKSAHGAPVRLLMVTTRNGEAILVGRDVSQVRMLRDQLLHLLIGSGIATLLVTGILAVALSLPVLRRVQALEQAAAAVAAGRLDARMPVAGRHDELDRFAATVNAMVAEVERLLEQTRGVTDAIAHDLRTPLTRLRARLGRAAGDTAPPAVQALAREAADDLDLVLGRFAALLRISALAASQRRTGYARTDLAALATRVAELYEPLAEEAGVALAIGPLPPARALADEELLFEALSNLVDNAIKFARGRVAITLTDAGDLVRLTVGDDGPGIAPGERDAMLERFRRGAQAATHGGSGLGLSIVAAIVRLHGFRLCFDGGDGAFAASLEMPRA